MKTKIKILILLLILGILFISGCESVQLNGFSVGATYLNTNIMTINSTDAGVFGQFTNKQETKVEGLMPIILFNFKFK